MATSGNESGNLPKTSEKSEHVGTLNPPSSTPEPSEKLNKSMCEQARQIGWVRTKYANYSPSNIREMKDRATLEWIYNEYRFPQDHWWNTVEEHYYGLISMCAWARMHYLGQCKDCAKNCAICKKTLCSEMTMSEDESEGEGEGESECESQKEDEMETAV